jgi:hypothetical protein
LLIHGLSPSIFGGVAKAKNTITPQTDSNFLLVFSLLIIDPKNQRSTSENKKAELTMGSSFGSSDTFFL